MFKRHLKEDREYFLKSLISLVFFMFPLVASTFALSVRHDTITLINAIIAFILVPILLALVLYLMYYEIAYYKGKSLEKIFRRKKTPKSEKRRILYLYTGVLLSMGVPYILNFVVLFQQNLFTGWGFGVVAYGVAGALVLVFWPARYY
jgi:uncharacterized membrane protein